jgi:hypothetical protein
LSFAIGGIIHHRQKWSGLDALSVAVVIDCKAFLLSLASRPVRGGKTPVKQCQCEVFIYSKSSYLLQKHVQGVIVTIKHDNEGVVMATDDGVDAAEIADMYGGRGRPLPAFIAH